MIVFGDPSFERTLGQVVSALSAKSGRVQRTEPANVQEVRMLLIEAGQVEQAVADLEAVGNSANWHRIARYAMAVTDACAALLLSANRGAAMETAWLQAECVTHGLVSASLENQAVANRCLRVKSPEGFAFYSLFPEQYIESADRWIQEQRRERPSRVLVIGVRSIGTSLSAIVKTTVAQAGAGVFRVTVRPTGSPLDRQAFIASHHTAGCSHALIVDEGPGLSGSSMAAVARTLVEGGFSRGRIAFFPGSPSAPGPAATDEVRRWWRDVPRYWTPLERSRIAGELLIDQLSRRSSELTHRRSGGCESVAGGIWRKRAFRRESDWPGVVPLFERQKYLSQPENGEAVLWKFAGLSLGCNGVARSASELDQLSRLASSGFTPETMGSWNGYVATKWIDGTRLFRTRDNRVRLHRVANYLGASCELPMSHCEAIRGLERLQGMLHQNTLESLGSDAAASVLGWSNEVGDALRSQELAAYPDGRLAPHEWIQNADGALLKADAAGHNQDHTIIGQQLLAWDVAGLAVEWGLSLEDLQSFVTTLRISLRAEGGDISPSCDLNVIAFHIAAYCAFRTGMCTLGVETAVDEEEGFRLRRDRRFYVARLTQSLHHHRSFHDDLAGAVDAQHPRAA